MSDAAAGDRSTIGLRDKGFGVFARGWRVGVGRWSMGSRLDALSLHAALHTTLHTALNGAQHAALHRARQAEADERPDGRVDER